MAYYSAAAAAGAYGWDQSSSTLLLEEQKSQARHANGASPLAPPPPSSSSSSIISAADNSAVPVVNRQKQSTFLPSTPQVGPTQPVFGQTGSVVARPAVPQGSLGASFASSQGTGGSLGTSSLSTTFATFRSAQASSPFAATLRDTMAAAEALAGPSGTLVLAASMRHGLVLPPPQPGAPLEAALNWCRHLPLIPTALDVVKGLFAPLQAAGGAAVEAALESAPMAQEVAQSVVDAAGLVLNHALRFAWQGLQSGPMVSTIKDLAATLAERAEDSEAGAEAPNSIVTGFLEASMALATEVMAGVQDSMFIPEGPVLARVEEEVMHASASLLQRQLATAVSRRAAQRTLKTAILARPLPSSPTAATPRTPQAPRLATVQGSGTLVGGGGAPRGAPPVAVAGGSAPPPPATLLPPGRRRAAQRLPPPTTLLPFSTLLPS